MWKMKEWKLSEKEKYAAWEKANCSKYEIVEIFVNNGYCVEYRKLKEL